MPAPAETREIPDWLKEVSTEDLIDAVSDFIQNRIDREQEYHETEDYWDQYSEYAYQDIDYRPLRDVLYHVDDDLVEKTIEKLRALGVKDDEIKELITEASTTRYKRGYGVSSNSVGSTSLPEEDEIYFDPYDNIVVQDQNTELDVVLKEIMERTAREQLVHKLRRMHGFGDKFITDILSGKQAYGTIGHSTARVEAILDPQAFVLAARRFIKDMKILKKQGEKFPALTKVMRDLWR